jgi:hypothetical protein
MKTFTNNVLMFLSKVAVLGRGKKINKHQSINMLYGENCPIVKNASKMEPIQFKLRNYVIHENVLLGKTV